MTLNNPHVKLYKWQTDRKGTILSHVFSMSTVWEKKNVLDHSNWANLNLIDTGSRDPYIIIICMWHDRGVDNLFFFYMFQCSLLTACGGCDTGYQTARGTHWPAHGRDHGNATQDRHGHNVRLASLHLALNIQKSPTAVYSYQYINRNPLQPSSSISCLTTGAIDVLVDCMLNLRRYQVKAHRSGEK